MTAQAGQSGDGDGATAAQALTGLWRIAAQAPARPAMVAPDGRLLSYGELAAWANQISHGFAAHKLGRGDRVAMVMRNGADTMAFTLAALQSGLYVVPINYHATADDIRYILENSEARLFLADAAFAETCVGGCQSPSLSDVIKLGVGTLAGFTPFADFYAGQPPSRPAQTWAGQIMQYTSGTTGRPKGVLRPLIDGDGDAFGDAQIWLLKVFGVEAGPGAHLVTAPLYHTAVMSMALSAIHIGQTLVLMDKWDAAQALALIERHHVTTTHMVATHFHRMLSLPEAVRKAHDLSSLTHVIHGAVPTPVDLKRRMIEWLGPVVYEYYGSSEAGATMVTSEQWLRRPGTVGRPIAISELKILDDDKQPVPVGQPGWIYMKQGDQDFRYYKDEAKTKKASLGGFICVGDIGYIDEDGYLFLCGRDAEIIISGGVNIYPAATEAHLLTHPAVADVAVIGVPDAEFGEQVRAVVCLKPSYRPGPELAAALIDHCRQSLSHLCCPKSVDFVDSLPRDPSGKLYKHRIRAPYWQGHESMPGERKKSDG